MDVNEYRKQFLEQLRFDAAHDGSAPEIQFIEQTLSKLEETGDVNDPMTVSIEIRGRRGRLMAFDAYAYDEADCALVMIASDFSNEIDNVQTLTNTRIDELLTRMMNFIDESVNGRMADYCDDSDHAIIIAREIKDKIGKGMTTSEILRFKFIILSNSFLSKQVKNVSRENFLERPVELNIWNIERLFDLESSNSSEIIEINTEDFGCDGIQCLKADIGEDADYEAYLGIVPGRFLAEVYLKYGSKLLQGNVRAFLSVRGKVNQGIRKTIINHPENFFTYNNGIAVVARSVRFSSDKSRIVFFKDLQIINGGQTTASLANAIIKKEKSADAMFNLFVPMKLTVLNVENEMSEEEIDRYNDITKEISRCANSQNAVNDADFFSNHPFHVLMEKISLSTMAPPVDGNPYQTIWYYERSRGKWEQDQMKLTPAQRVQFCNKHPKNQVIKKEYLAKCLNAFAMRPYEVCQSSLINFKRYASTIEDIYENSRESINDVYFKKCICCVIIFNSLDKIINKAVWYPTGGNKAQIVPYTISKLMYMLPKDKDLDWTTIWKKQSMYYELSQELERIALIIHEFLMEKADGGIVRSISRKSDIWKSCQDLNITFSDTFLNSLISKAETKVEEQAAKKQRKFDSAIDLSVEVFKLGENYWRKLYSLVNEEKLSPYGDLMFINSIADYIKKGSLPSSAQCKKLKRIIEKIEDKGFIMPD